MYVYIRDKKEQNLGICEVKKVRKDKLHKYKQFLYFVQRREQLKNEP
jgi:hypothetical protein